jgi:hypothetical protein
MLPFLDFVPFRFWASQFFGVRGPFFPGFFRDNSIMKLSALLTDNRGCHGDHATIVSARDLARVAARFAFKEIEGSH